MEVREIYEQEKRDYEKMYGSIKSARRRKKANDFIAKQEAKL